MNPDYMLACGVVWRKTADPEAGLELVEGLESPDLRVRALAHALLIDGAENSMRLLESALTAGVVSPEAAGPCMAEILRSSQAKQTGGGPTRQVWSDVSLC
ncbi:MAG: hypothetical protein WA628_13175 [Terriglobales bacterium]